MDKFTNIKEETIKNGIIFIKERLIQIALYLFVNDSLNKLCEDSDSMYNLNENDCTILKRLKSGNPVKCGVQCNKSKIVIVRNNKIDSIDIIESIDKSNHTTLMESYNTIKDSNKKEIDGYFKKINDEFKEIDKKYCELTTLSIYSDTFNDILKCGQCRDINNTKHFEGGEVYSYWENCKCNYYYLSNDDDTYDTSCDKNDPKCKAYKLIPNINPSGLSCDSNLIGSSPETYKQFESKHTLDFDCDSTQSNKCKK